MYVWGNTIPEEEEEKVINDPARKLLVLCATFSSLSSAIFCCLGLHVMPDPPDGDIDGVAKLLCEALLQRLCPSLRSYSESIVSS